MDRDVGWQYLTEDETVTAFSTNESTGLKAAAVSHRRVRFGDNLLWPIEGTSIRALAARYTLDSVIILFLANILCAFFLGFGANFFLILAITTLFTVFRIACDFTLRNIAVKNAEKFIPECSVIRDAKSIVVDGREIVPGDIILLREGDIVPADARILRANDLVVSEKGITGNEMPVEKITEALHKRPANDEIENMSNMLFATSYVLSGECRAVCTATGSRTVVAKKRKITRTVPKTSFGELKKAERLSALVGASLLAVALVYILVAVFFLKGKFSVADVFLEALCFAACGFGSVWHTIILFTHSLRIVRLFRAGTYLRSGDVAVKTDDAAALVVTDVSQLREKNCIAERVVCAGKVFAGAALDKRDPLLDEFYKMLAISTGSLPGQLATDGIIPEFRMEDAVADHLRRTGKKPSELAPGISLGGFAPKSADNHFDTAVYYENGEYHAVCSGDTAKILSLCRTVYMDGYEETITPEKREEYLALSKKLEDSGLRLIALAHRIPPVNTISRLPVIQNNLAFVGFIALKFVAEKDTRALIENFLTAQRTVLCFASSRSEAFFAATGEMVPGARLFAVRNPDEAQHISFEKGGRYVVCIPFDSVDKQDADRMRLILIRKLKKTSGDIICAGSELTDGVCLREASVKIALRKTRRFRPVPYSVIASADAVCESRSGCLSTPGTVSLLSADTIRPKYAFVRMILLASQLLRTVLLVVSLFVTPMIPPAIFLAWSCVVDVAAGYYLLNSDKIHVPKKLLKSDHEKD